MIKARFFRIAIMVSALVPVSLLSTGIVHSAETPIDGILAIVNDDIVLTSEFTRERDAMLQRNQAGLPRGEALDKLIVERLIVQSLQLQEAERQSIRIDDASLQRALEDMANNNNMTVTKLRESVTAQGMDFLQFREDLRKDLLISTLTRRQINSAPFVSDAEVEEQLSTDQNRGGEYRYTLEHILVKLPEQADSEQNAKALTLAQSLASKARDGESFESLVRAQRQQGLEIEGGNLGSRSVSEMPALFAQQMPGMQKDDVTEPLRSAAGFHVLKLINRTTISQITPTSVKARHILVSTREGRTSSEAQQRITAIQQKLAEGENFEQLARSFSDDKSSAVNGGDLGWFGPGEMVKEFENVAFSTAVNVRSQPFKTAFGWHVLEVLEQKLPENPESNLINKTREELRQKKAEERFQTWLGQLRDNAYVELRGFAKDYQ